MWCHICYLDFDTYEDFKDHILKFHRDPSTWNVKSEKPDYKYESPLIEIKDEDTKDEIDVRNETLIIEDEIDIKDENHVLNTFEMVYDSGHSTAEENKSSDIIATENSYSFKDNIIVNAVKEEPQDTSPRKLGQCTINKNKLISDSNKLEKGYDSGQSTAVENKSADIKVSLNTLTEKPYRLNEDIIANARKKGCHHEDTSQRELGKRTVKNKFVSDSIYYYDFTKIPKKHQSSPTFKNHLQKNKNSLKDSSPLKKPTSYEEGIHENSSTGTTKQSNRLSKKSCHLNSQILLGQSSNSESQSANCPPTFINMKPYDSVQNMTAENRSLIVVLNPLPEKYLNNISNTSLKKCKQFPNKSKPVSNSNISKKLLEKSRKLSLMKKQVQEKKVSNLKNKSKPKISGSNLKKIREYTESSSKLRPCIVKNEPVSDMLPKKCGKVLKKRLPKKQKKISFNMEGLPKCRTPASYQEDICEDTDANIANQSKSSFSDDDNTPPQTSFNIQPDKRVDLSNQKSFNKDNISSTSVRKQRHKLMPKKYETVLKEPMIKKQKKIREYRNVIQADKSKNSFIHPQSHASSNLQSETHNSQPITNTIPIAPYSTTSNVDAIKADKSKSSFIYHQPLPFSNLQSNLQPTANNIPIVGYPFAHQGASNSVLNFVAPQPHTSSNLQFEILNSQPIANDIPIPGCPNADQGLSKYVLEFVATNATRLQSLNNEFDFSSTNILNRLTQLKKMCKSLQYPLTQSLTDTIKVVHTAIYDLYSKSLDKREKSAVLKMYEELDVIILKHINSI